MIDDMSLRLLTGLQGPIECVFFEDVPMSLVQIASLIHCTDNWRRGRTVEKLGLEQWSVGERTRFVQEGKVDQADRGWIDSSAGNQSDQLIVLF